MRFEACDRGWKSGRGHEVAASRLESVCDSCEVIIWLPVYVTQEGRNNQNTSDCLFIKNKGLLTNLWALAEGFEIDNYYWKGFGKGKIEITGKRVFDSRRRSQKSTKRGKSYSFEHWFSLGSCFVVQRFIKSEHFLGFFWIWYQFWRRGEGNLLISK